MIGIEDKENWHGKPLGEKGIEIIKVLQEELTKKDTSLKPKPSSPEFQLEDIDFGSIKLADEPQYTKGEKVTQTFIA